MAIKYSSVAQKFIDACLDAHCKQYRIDSYRVNQTILDATSINYIYHIMQIIFVMENFCGCKALLKVFFVVFASG